VTTLQVTVVPDRCIGSGECVRVLPESFAIDETRGVDAQGNAL